MSQVGREFLANLWDLSVVLPQVRRLAAEKRIGDRVTLCSACGGEPFPTLLALQLVSIVRREPVLPRVHVAYDGERPSLLEGFPFVELAPIVREPGPHGPRFWNFVGKTTSLRSARTPLACWIDSDIVLLRALTPHLRGNAFIPMGDRRLGGGLYCLEREFVAPVTDAVLGWRDRLDTDDDRRCLVRAVEDLSIVYEELPDLDVELGTQKSFNDGAEYPWLHLSEGKADQLAYVELWLRELDRLVHLPGLDDTLLPRWRPDRVGPEGFCLARPGAFYLCGRVEGGPITVDLAAERCRFWVEWFDLETGRLRPAGEVEGGDRETFFPLGSESSLLYLSRDGSEGRASRNRENAVYAARCPAE